MFPTVYALDTSIATTIDSGRSPLFIHIYELFTQLGDARAITVVALALAFVLWRHKRFAYKAGFAVALFGALFSAMVIKLIVERPRPPHPFSLFDEPGYSFPSMHAAVSMATYGFLAYVIWKILHPPHHRLPAVIALMCLIALIGFSRIYLGVHYFSDVAAGYAIGAIFIYIGVRVTRAFSSKRDRARVKAKPSSR